MKKIRLALLATIVAIAALAGCSAAKPGPADAFASKMVVGKCEMGVADGWINSSTATFQMAAAPDQLSDIRIATETPAPATLDDCLTAIRAKLDSIESLQTRVELAADRLTVNTYEALRYQYASEVGDYSLITTYYYIIQKNICYTITYRAINGADFGSDIDAMLASVTIKK